MSFPRIVALIAATAVTAAWSAMSPLGLAGDFYYHFTDAGHAQFTYRVDGDSGSVPIAREPF